MAKPKVKVLVQTRSETVLDVYADNLPGILSDILSVEGVRKASIMDGCVSTFTDPRYDIEEIAREIEALLLSEVPDIFRGND